MKMIYLWDEDVTKWKEFDLSTIDVAELEKRNIVISPTAHIGNNIFINHDVYIGDDTIIGNNVVFWQNVFVGKRTHIEQNNHISCNVKIGDDVYIGRNVSIIRETIICDNSHISDNCYIGGDGTIIEYGVYIDCNTRIIGDKICIKRNARIGSHVSITGNVDMTYIGPNAVIDNDIHINNKIHLSQGAHLKKDEPICIIRILGSKWPINYWGENKISIGCETRSIEAWLTDYEDIANEYNFTPKEIEEYRTYVEYIKSIHDKRKKKEPA
jgi:UDP-3-O-[3-hydroxymyristoyl] glucosamine N-acyltransferase